MKVWYQFEINDEIAAALTKKYGKGDLRKQFETEIRKGALVQLAKLLDVTLDEGVVEQLKPIRESKKKAAAKKAPIMETITVTEPNASWLDGLAAATA